MEKLTMLETVDADFERIVSFAQGLPEVQAEVEKRFAVLRADVPGESLTLAANICVPRTVEEADK